MRQKVFPLLAEPSVVWALLKLRATRKEAPKLWPPCSAAELLFVYFSLLILFFPPFLLQKFTFND